MSNKGLVLKQNIENIAEAIREPQGLITYNMININVLRIGYVTATGNIVAQYMYGEKCSDFIKVNPNTTYTFEIYETSSTFDHWIGIGEYSENNYETFIQRDVMFDVTQNYYTFTTSSTCEYIIVSSRNLIEATKIGLSQGNRTAYKPYCKYKVREMTTGINNLVDTLKSYIPHRSTSGNPLSINSIPLKPKELNIVGNSKQETTTGANKMKFDERTSTYLNYKCDSKGNVTMFGTLTSTVGLGYNLSSNYVSLTAGTYTLKLKGNSKNIVFSFLGYRINGSESDINYTFTINSDVSNFQVMQNPVENTNINVNYRITLASGTVGTDEFYTNEIPSPNLNYIQNINNVKSSNGIINYNKTGKNKFNYEYASDFDNTTFNTYRFIEIKDFDKTKRYLLSGIDTSNFNELDNVYIILAKDNQFSGLMYGLTLCSNSNHIANSKYVLETDLNAEKLYIGIYTSQNVTEEQYNKIISKFENTQLEEMTSGDIPTTYEPYKHDIIPFNIGTTEFCKLYNGVADKLWVNLRTGQYGKTKHINKKVLDGTDYWSLANITNLRYPLGLACTDMKERSSLLGNFVKSNYFLGNSSNEGSPSEKDWCTIRQSNGGYTVWFFIPKKYFTETTAEGIKREWNEIQVTNNIILYYELATPTSEVLGTLSKENLAKLVMYNGINNISINGYDDNGSKPVIEIDYYTQS